MARRKRLSISSGTLLSLIAVGGVMTLGLVLGSAIWASRESDVAALDHQRQLVNSRLESQLQSVADELGLMADGYAHTIDPASPSGQMDASRGMAFGDIITSVFKYDAAFVVRPDGELALQADPGAVSRYEWIRPLVMPMLQRTIEARSGGHFDPVRPETAETVELMRLQGRPSIAGIIPIGAGNDRNGQQSLFLIAYRYLDGPALDALSRDQGLSGVRFARSADPEANEVTFQIEASGTKEPIGFIIWTPDLPGSKVVISMLPAMGASALIIASLLLGLVFLLRRSLSDLQRSEQRARHQSLHDVLTGLPNRALFGQKLDDCIAHLGAAAAPAALALIDLDKFKAVNDTLGHAAGDELIQMVAQRITDLIGPGDMLARLGGDEFALLLPQGQGTSDTSLFDRIVEAIAQPFVLQTGQGRAHIGCSIGVTMLLPSARTASEALHRADVALYQAKLRGRGRCVHYAEEMDTDAKRREALKADLRAFLDQADAASPAESLEVFYQTIHCAAQSDQVSGAEALVRWRHPRLGLLGPDKFIALAEDSGLIDRLGQFVLRRACTAAALWPNDAFLAVNVSPTQLRKPSFAEEVMDILTDTGLPAKRLELEVTESALIASSETTVVANLSRLRAHGVKVALDDFGTGYSSLSHLIQFPIDRLKIDRSFVRLLGTRADGAAIVSAVVALSQNLGLATTAEGVETTGQRDFLIAAGCTDLQGYLFSKPVPELVMETVSKAQQQQA